MTEVAGNGGDSTRTGRFSVRELALNVGAVAGLVCIIAAAVSLFLGVTPLVFRSGSMSPQIQTGALAFSRTVPAADLAVGDVISVNNDQGVRITHRIVALEPSDGGGAVVTLKGDANPVPDLTPYTITEADRVFFHINGLGYVVVWLSSPMAIFIGGMLVGAVLVFAFGKRRDKVAEDAAIETDSDGTLDSGLFFPASGPALTDDADFSGAIKEKHDV